MADSRPYSQVFARLRSAAAAGLALLALVWGPAWIGPYWGLVVFTALLQGTVALSYDLIGGYGGELHLGHGLFFGLGAYLSAGMLTAGLPAWTTPVLSGFGGAAVALALCPLLIPLRGIPFAIASLAALLLMGLLAGNLSSLTGGHAGLSLMPRWGLPGLLRAAFLLMAATGWMHYCYPNSRHGRALRAVADDREAAAAMGVNPSQLRRQALILGAFPAAVAGSLYPFQSAYISPQSAFGLEAAMAPVAMVLVGGPGSRWGPLLGLVLLTAVQEWLWTQGWQWRLSMWGAVLVMAGVLLPHGLAGLFPIKQRSGRSEG